MQGSLWRERGGEKELGTTEEERICRPLDGRKKDGLGSMKTES